MKKVEKITGHQGDVQFKTATIPTNAKKINNTPLAYGEISGHVHIITGDVEMFECEGKMFGKIIGDGARLQHVLEHNVTERCLVETKELPVADHGSILLPPGTYEFGIQKRYNPFEKVFERVVD